jgi:hypothetical protein
MTSTKFLFFSLTKKNNSSDLSCVIQPGVGVPAFIIQESVVHYKEPRAVESEKIQELISKNECLYKGSFSPNILYRIQKGATESDRIPLMYEEIAKEYLGTT